MQSYDTKDMPNVLADNGVQSAIGSVMKPLGGILKMPNILPKVNDLKTTVPLKDFIANEG